MGARARLATLSGLVATRAHAPAEMYPSSLSPLMQFVASLVPSLFKPADTLPQWTAWLVVGFTVWFFHFVCTRKPDAIRQEEARRRKNILDMKQAVVAYVDAEDAKPEDTRKLPELCRV